MKKSRSGTRTFVLCAIACLYAAGPSSLSAEGPGRGAASVNSAAAVRSLEKATSLLGSGDWAGASFEARLGASYDRGMADFPWIEALSLAARGAPRADILERVNQALSDGLSWRTYTRAEALTFSARLLAETGKYREALAELDRAGKPSTADADHIRVLSLYGLGRIEEARALVSSSLEHWPFDARFPRTFLFREADNAASREAVRIAAVILSRLYLWQNDDRELLVLAVPFQSDPSVRVRDLLVYRGMGRADTYGVPGATQQPVPLSAVYALEYGIIDEKTAEAEIFADSKAGVRRECLAALCRLAGSPEVRASIASRLASFDGLLVDDANGDGIDDTRILYRLGRPVQAAFDPDQDGYPDYTVDCNLGLPSTIACRSGNPVVTYDTYPFVRTAAVGVREYTLKPLALSWAPVSWVKEDFRLPGDDFFTLTLDGRAPALTERLLVSSSVYYRETASDREGGENRVSLENGIPVSSEARENGRVYSWTTYTRGYPSLTKADRDGDGYFETTTSYDLAGGISSVLVDRNGNRRVEYREEFLPDGTSVMRWDSDENGYFEISFTRKPDGSEITEWARDSGVPVVITVENGSPRSVRYGEMTRTVLRDPLSSVWWIQKIPARSRDIVKKLEESFNRSGDPVVCLTVTVDGALIQAVRTGGLIFAEQIDD